MVSHDKIWQTVDKEFARENVPSYLHGTTLEYLESGRYPLGAMARSLRDNYGLRISRDDLCCWYRHHRPNVTTAQDPDIGVDRENHPVDRCTCEPTARLHSPNCASLTEVDPLDEAVEEARQQAQRHIDTGQLKALVAVEARKRAYIDAVTELAPTVLRAPVLRFDTTAQGTPEHEWVLLLSDLQLGQKTTLEETGGLFEFSTEIATHQFQRLNAILTRLHEINRQAKNITRLHIIANGDIVDNDNMRRGQAAHIDRFVMEQCLEATNLFSNLILHALSLFPEVTLYVCPGNHDRSSEKGDTAGLGEIGGAIDTYSWLMGQMLKREFAQVGDVKVVVSDAYVQAAKIAGKRVVWEHGGSIQSGTSHAGIPLAGIVNAAEKYSAMYGGLDYLLLSHFHVPYVVPIFGGKGMAIGNGAFPPSSDYAQKKLKLVGRPQQWLLDFHREFGVVGYNPIYLDDKSFIRSATYWDEVEGSNE